MSSGSTIASSRRKPLRLWPGVVLAVLLVVAKFGVPLVAPTAMLYSVLGILRRWGFVVWWTFFSRAPWAERLGALALMAAAVAATPFVLHESIATGMMGMMIYIHAVPVLTLAFVVSVVASRGLTSAPRRVVIAATILLACGGWSLVRTYGFTGDGNSDFAWRWAQSPEDRLLATAGDVMAQPAAAAPSKVASMVAGPNVAETVVTASGAIADVPPLAASTATAPVTQTTAVAAPEPRDNWPGFRGPDRDGTVRGVQIATDWSASPPVELWRRPIGPGWSSFAVRGDLLYTQEQRGVVDRGGLARPSPQILRYTEAVPNLTLSIQEDTLRRARIRALEQGTSVNAVVRDFLVWFGGMKDELRARATFVELSEGTVAGVNAAGRGWRREDLYEERLRWPRS